MKLEALVRLLDETLPPGETPGDSSLNGLQVEGRPTVRRVACAVDACEASIRGAVRKRTDILLVHHGLFWREMRPVTGGLAARLQLLLANGLSLYASHLPLDRHPTIGNNALLAGLIGLEHRESFGMYHGVAIGLSGALARPVAAAALAARIRRALRSPVQLLPFGPARVRRLAIVSGNGASLAAEAAAAGCDALLTGEAIHSAYHPAKEARIHLICAGHYATETPGVRALGDLVRCELGLPVSFIDVPTGL